MKALRPIALLVAADVLLWSAASGAEPLRDPANTTRLLVVGFDSIDWQVADPLIEAGRMPNLSRLISKGCRIRLRTITPTLSPIIWTTIATGRTPADHGILDFSGGARNTRALWNIASDAGITTGVVGWWATWPAETINGYVVSDRAAFLQPGMDEVEEVRLDTAAVTPVSLWADVGRELVSRNKMPFDVVRRFIDIPADWETSAIVNAEDIDRTSNLRRFLAQAESNRRIALMLHRQQKPVLDMVYFHAPDQVSHIFMQFRPPLMEGVDPIRAKWFGSAVDRIYEECDRILGELVPPAETEGAAIVVLSDHGFRNGADRPSTDPRTTHGGAADWHRKYGIMVCAGAPFVSGGSRIEDASVMDVMPTLLTALGLPVSDEMPGRVLSEAFAPGFLNAHPLRRIASYEVSPRSSAPRRADRREVLAEIERLQDLAALGYIEPRESADSDAGAGPNYHNNRGTVALQEGDLDGAIREFRMSLDLGPDASGVRVNLAQAYRRNGDIASARASLAPLLALAKPEKLALQELGRLEMDDRNWEAAERAFRAAREADPNDAGILCSIAELYEMTGRIDAAIAANKRAIGIEPENEQGYNNLGNICRDLGRLDEAEAWYRKAIAADAEFGGSFNNLGLVLKQLGRFKEAELELQAALDKYRHSGGAVRERAVVQNSLGTLYYQQSPGDRSMIDAAMRKFLEAIETDPSYAEAHNNLGVVYGLLGRSADEIREYETAVGLQPLYSDGLLNLARASYARGDLTVARQCLERAIGLDPVDPATRSLLSIIEEQH